MKNFKSLLTEIINDGSQYKHPEYQQLNNRLFEIIHDKMENVGPKFVIKEKKGSSFNSSRMYKWNDWHTAMNSLSQSISIQSLLGGTLTGKRGDIPVSNEERNFLNELIIQKHSPAINQFKEQHHMLVNDIERSNPEAHSIIKKLTTHYGMPYKDISDLHFEKRMNQILTGHQTMLIDSVEKMPPHVLKTVLNINADTYNKQISKHDHPLGFFLNGGPPPHTGAALNHFHPGVFAPGSVHRGNALESENITDEYFENPHI